MVDDLFFKFPTLKDGSRVVEEALCELMTRYRNGETLAPEAIDWMDSANTWLSSSDNH